MSPPYERYEPHVSQPPAPSWGHSAEAPQTVAPIAGQPSALAPRLPFFEAAIARARGAAGTYPIENGAIHFDQPLPSYAAPADPNHPDLSVGLLQSNTIRMAMDGNSSRQRRLSRSPSPVDAASYDQRYGFAPSNRWQSHEDEMQDHRNRLLDQGPIDSAQEGCNERWDEKKSSLGLDNVDDGDLALPPFLGISALPEAGHYDQTHEGLVPKNEYSPIEGDLAGSTTQHFGPAPTGRVGRRTHNAESGRRIRHTATLDENGFFAVDMPIPTRLAQFLPFKGVEEQKCTRFVSVLLRALLPKSRSSQAGILQSQPIQTTFQGRG